MRAGRPLIPLGNIENQWIERNRRIVVDIPIKLIDKDGAKGFLAMLGTNSLYLLKT